MSTHPHLFFCWYFVVPQIPIAFEDFLFQVQPTVGDCLSGSTTTEQFFSPQRYLRLLSIYINMGVCIYTERKIKILLHENRYKQTTEPLLSLVILKLCLHTVFCQSQFFSTSMLLIPPSVYTTVDLCTIRLHVLPVAGVCSALHISEMAFLTASWDLKKTVLCKSSYILARSQQKAQFVHL